MVSKTVLSLALLFNITGTYLIYKYGLPEEVSRSGYDTLVVSPSNTDEIKKAQSYDKFSRLGFRMLLLGFGMQLFCVWL